MELHHMQAHYLYLSPLCHVEEDDETQPQGVDDCCHLVAISVCDEVFEDHGPH